MQTTHVRHAMTYTRPVMATASASLIAGLLVALSGTAAQAAPTRYEAETSPAVCTGTIDTDWAGFSGTGFCNGTNAVGAYAPVHRERPRRRARRRWASGSPTAPPPPGPRS